MLRIGIDLMGSDSSPELLFPALVALSKDLTEEVLLVPVATQKVIDALQAHLKRSGVSLDAISPLVAEDSIEMSDAPLTAIRSKRQASMTIAMRRLANGDLDALVSAGNTGALMASAAMYLDALPGVTRPPLLALIPTAASPVAVLDVGGLVNWHAEQLVQFAILGAAFQRVTSDIMRPRVALLNIGAEAMKGNTELRRAYGKLCESTPDDLLFIGNIEGRDVFQAKADVLVTDGFTGNVFLKASEGVAGFLLDSLRQRVERSGNVEWSETIADLVHMTDHAEHPGAIVCGVDKLVIKCHGAATSRGLENAVRGALHYLGIRLIPRLKEELRKTFT